jgi:hypothetical protein
MTLAFRAPTRGTFHVKHWPLRCPRQDLRPGLTGVRPPREALALVAASRASDRAPTSRSPMPAKRAAGRHRGPQMWRGRQEIRGPLAWSHATVLRWAGSVRMPIVVPGSRTRGRRLDHQAVRPDREAPEPDREAPEPDRKAPEPGPRWLSTGRSGQARTSHGRVRQYPEKGRFGPRLFRDLFLPGGQRRVRPALLSRVHTPAR